MVSVWRGKRKTNSLWSKGYGHNYSAAARKVLKLATSVLPLSLSWQLGIGVQETLGWGGSKVLLPQEKENISIFVHGKEKSKGFKKVAKSIAKKQGISNSAASAILAASSRKASKKAKAKNPKLKKVKGNLNQKK